jgi:uncharacterized protein YbcI
MAKSLSLGQISDSISKQVTRFYAETIGQGPQETRVYIIEDMIIVRLKGKLLPFEEKLLEKKSGIDLIKNIRGNLHEILTDKLGKLISEITRHQVVSSHNDISTKTGEIIEVFILDINYEAELKNQLSG